MDVLEEMHRCRCGTQVPFYSIAECSCSTRWKYSIRCHIEGCITEHCTTHGTCWSRHLPRASDTAWADNDDDHLPVDPKGQLFARTVIFSETNGESLSRMHAEDKLSRWFHIQQHGSQPKLCVYDRFSQITDPSRSGNVASAKQYPGFVSFIGKSGVGKSTLVRAMVLLGALNESGLLENQDDWMYNRFHTLNAFASILSEGREVPVTKSGNLNDLIDPTTFGVHLYKDGQEAPASEELERTQCPILFADCEGFYAGNALPNSELYDENAPESAYALQRHLLYEEDIVSPSYNTHDKRGAELFYARYLYAISDTIVFVSDDDNLMEHSITSIFEWAAAAVHNSVNHPSRKTLIIVRHKGADHRPELYDDNVLRRAYLNQRRKIWTGSKILDKFVTDYNSKQDMSACIYDNTDLYKVLFSDISCCYIPNKNNVNCKPDDLFRQYRSLRDKIDGASQRAQSLRQKGWAQYNSATLSSILLKAFEHFRQSEEPFDFYRAARNDNPTPRGFADHIANFLRLAFQSLSDKEETLKMTQQSIALSFITWAMRNFDHWVDPGEMFDRGEGGESGLSLEALCETAFRQYEARFEQCYFYFPQGERCIIRPVGSHTHHQSATGRRAYGDMIPKYQYAPNWVQGVREHFIHYYNALVTDDGITKRPTEKPLRYIERGRRERYMQRHHNQWRQIRSNKTCLACLQRVPENVLQCGHAYCILCVQELGTESEEYECSWAMNHCSLCWDHQSISHLVRLKPQCAGARILTLDGGGIRGVIELAILKRLSEGTGLGIHFRDYFDLILGTSTGGIIALALAMQDATIDEMTDKFIKFATDTFSRPNAGDMLTRLKIGHIMTKMFMALGFTRTMFDSSPLRAGLVEFFGDDTLLFSMARKRKHQCSTRVAVVAATDIGDTMRLIPSYNRSDLSDCTDFEREDDDSMSMKIWEAAMATSAAPFYLPKFLKIETGKEYVDGALYANCPAETALREMKKLWPENRASLDILLSLGTGQQKKEIKLPKTVKIGGFEETVRSFHNNLDTQKLWEKFLRTEAAETVKGRLHRLNPEIKPEMGYISIYAYERMETLMNMVHDQAKLPTLGGGLKDVAINLLANLFFFEPDDENLPSAIRRSSTNLAAARDSVTLSGTIRSRLRHKSVELKSLLSKSSGFASAILPEAYATHASELPPNLHWTEISHFCEMRRKVQDNKGMFRLPVTLKGYRSPHVLAIKMNEAPERWIPISGFPVSTGELLRRIASHA